MCETNHQYKTDSGNVIIWILITIALLAALTFTFTQSSRTSTSLLSDEVADSMAKHLVSFSNDVKQTVKRLQLRGCDETEISFENSVLGFNYTNPNAPADNSCHVFDINGGGLQVPTLPEAIFDLTPNFIGATYTTIGIPYFRGNVIVENIKTGSPELILWVPFIKNEVCLSLNNILGTPDPAVGDGHSSTPNSFFTGDFTPAGGDSTVGDQDTSYAEIPSACYMNNNLDFLFYTTLIRR